MNLNLALLRREWIQHRFSWALLALIPLALVTLLLSVGHIELEVGDKASGLPAPLAVVAAAMGIGAVLMMLLSTVFTTTTVIGLARRDHADRSVEFWLSLPIGHSRSLLLPMLVHMVLVPLAAAVLGLLLGWIAGLILVTRMHGFGAWLALPWADLTGTTLLGLARLLVGWPMLVLWLSPLILLGMLSYAWMRRWGLVILGLVLAVGNSQLGEILGYRWLPDVLRTIGRGAVGALVNGKQAMVIQGDNGDAIARGMQQAPMWLLHDVGGSLRDMASPVFLGGLLVAALCFWGLIAWRKRGASTAV